MSRLSENPALERVVERIIQRLASAYLNEGLSWEAFQTSASVVKAVVQELYDEEKNRRENQTDRNRKRYK